MAQRPEIVVRRARVGDVSRVVALVNHARQEQPEIDERAVIARLGSAGFLLAEQDGNLIGILGWQIENLIVRVSDFLIWPARERIAVGRLLLSEMELSAAELQCEVALLLLPSQSPPDLVEFCKVFGYAPKVVAGLPKAWREASHEAGLGNDEAILIKQLRFDRVLRPL